MHESFASKLSVVLLTLTAMTSILHSQDRRIAPSGGGRRYALIIGNDAYPWKPLKNAVNDAQDLAAELPRVGFSPQDITLVTNANLLAMQKASVEFLERLRANDLAFIFYSGHGMEVHGENYLIPIDFPSNASDLAVEYQAFSAQRFLRDLEASPARTRIMILDACRDNPLRADRSGAGGLARMDGSGTLIVFATGSGRTADDNIGGRNGFFTAHLLHALPTPGISFTNLMQQVGREVNRDSGGKQTPALYGLLLEDFPLVPGPALGFSAASPISPAEEAWESVKDSINPDDLDEFVREFPTSDRVSVAKLRAHQLRRTSGDINRTNNSGASLPAPSTSQQENCSSATAESLQLSLKSQLLPRVLENLHCRPENGADSQVQSIVARMFEPANFFTSRHFLDGLSKSPLMTGSLLCLSTHHAITTGGFDGLAWLLSSSSDATQSCPGFATDLVGAFALMPSDGLSKTMSRLTAAGLTIEHDELALFRTAFEGYVGEGYPQLAQLSDLTAPGNAQQFNEAKSRAEAHLMSTAPLFTNGKTDAIYERSRQIIQKRMEEYCPSTAKYCAADSRPTVRTRPQSALLKTQLVDNGRHLTWTTVASAVGMDWPHAREYCANLEQAGRRDWRLPEVEELMALYDTAEKSSTCRTKTGQPITLHIREGIDPSCGDIWTRKKSGRQLRMGGFAFDYAWLFDFSTGAAKEEPATWLGAQTIYHHHVLCVRSAGD